MKAGQVSTVCGMPVFVSTLMTVGTEVSVTEELSFRERWIAPIRHPVTVPFEPWVKTRIKDVVVYKPAANAMFFPEFGYIMHPATWERFKVEIEKETRGEIREL